MLIIFVTILVITVEQSVTATGHGVPILNPYADPLFWKYYSIFKKSGLFNKNKIDLGVQSDISFPTKWPIVGTQPPKVIPAVMDGVIDNAQVSNQAVKESANVIQDSTSRKLSVNENSIQEKGSELFTLKDTVGNTVGLYVPFQGNSERPYNSLFDPSMSMNAPSLSSFTHQQPATPVSNQYLHSSGDLLKTLALTGGLTDVVDNPLLLSHFLNQGDKQLPQSDRLTLFLATGGEGVMQNPVILSHLLQQGQGQNKNQLLPTLALTGALQTTDPLVLHHLLQGSNTQGTSNILPLLAASGGGENMNPVLLHSILSSSNQPTDGGSENANTSGQQIQPNTKGIQDILPILALSGGGENMNPLLLHSFLSGSGSGQGSSNLLQILALSGGEESPLMQNPILLQHLLQSKGNNSINHLLPFLIGNE